MTRSVTAFGAPTQSLTDAQGQTTSYTYDAAGNKLTEIYPDHVPGSRPRDPGYGVVSLTLDAAGRTVQRTDQRGDTCDFTFDLAGRLTSKRYAGRTNAFIEPGATDTFTYDASGRMLTAVSGTFRNTVTFTYDAAGRKATESLTTYSGTFTTAIDYDAAGQVSSLTYPDGKVVDRTYTKRGQLASLAYDGTTIDNRTYDDGGRLSGSAYNNGVSESRTYNADNTLSGITFSGAPIGNLSYRWDANKNKTSERISGSMSGFGFAVGSSGYDDEDRLVGWNRDDGSLNQSWDLSLVGDWERVTQNGTSQTRTHGPTHEILSAAGQSVRHDANGNQTLIPAALTVGRKFPIYFRWDFNNRSFMADSNQDGIEDVFYMCDALGRRVLESDNNAGTTTTYVHLGQQIIADYTSGAGAANMTHTYVYGSYIDEPVIRTGGQGTVYYHRNQQYSVVALTDTGGQVIERYAYSAYGVPTILDASLSLLSTSSVNNRYLYTGREWDESLGLYYYRARLYNPVSGRFCSRDPIKKEQRTPLERRVIKAKTGRMPPYNFPAFKLYEYADSRPTKAADPSGLETWYVCTRYIEPQVLGGPEDSPTKVARTCKFRHADIYSSQGLVRVGFGGGGTPGTPPPLDDPDYDCTELVRDDFLDHGFLHWLIFGPTNRIIKHGTGAGKSCASATAADITSCIQSTPKPKGPSGLLTNCQTDCRETARGCCLTGYSTQQPPALPPNIPLPL